MFSDLAAQTRQILTGNLLMIGCCAFYLAWWLIAFKPEGAVKGLRSRWLLIPALLFGVAAVTKIVQGSGAVEGEALLIPRNAVLIGGVVVYIVLLIGTSVLLKRQVTTELFLIVGWTTLMFLELNALFAQGQFTKSTVIVFLVMTLIFAAVSMICYLLYYGLDKVKGYVDGMIPLLLVAVIMAVITVGAVISHR
ncbi:MAG: hypothetical protein LUD12_14630 [Lachnospiraceae bacterium]|nr:hypothetical protein [Lachnospiraceae bacterium]